MELGVEPNDDPSETQTWESALTLPTDEMLKRLTMGKAPDLPSVPSLEMTCAVPQASSYRRNTRNFIPGRRSNSSGNDAWYLLSAPSY